jgi:hypothetical protein
MADKIKRAQKPNRWVMAQCASTIHSSICRLSPQCASTIHSSICRLSPLWPSSVPPVPTLPRVSIRVAYRTDMADKYKYCTPSKPMAKIKRAQQTGNNTVPATYIRSTGAVCKYNPVHHLYEAVQAANDLFNPRIERAFRGHVDWQILNWL